MAAKCYTPSELARTVNKLPFPGYSDGIATGDSLDEVASAVVLNSVNRAVFWGCFIVILTIFFMILTSVFYCCLYCLRKKHSHGSTALKLWCEGCITMLVIAACLTIAGVTFWAQTSLNGDFEASSGNVIDALRQLDNSNPAGVEGFLSFETTTHRVVQVFAVVIILVQLVLTVSAMLSTIFKEKRFLKIMLAVLGVETLLISVIAGSGLATFTLLGDVCITSNEVYEQVVGGTFCNESRFAAICQLPVDGLCQLAGVSCNQSNFGFFGNLVGVCGTNISSLYHSLFQPLKNFCMNQMDCDANIGNLFELFTSSNCVALCNADSIFQFPPSPVLAIKELGCQRICGATVNELLDLARSFRLTNLQCSDQDIENYCNIFSGSLCTDQDNFLAPVVGDLNTICSQAYFNGFILLVMVCMLIIILILIQVAVATYTASLGADNSDPDSGYGLTSGTDIALQMKAFHSGVQEV